MSQATDFVKLLKSIAGFIGGGDFLSVLMFVQVSELLTQMEMENIRDKLEPMMALLLLLLQKGFISITKFGKLEELAEVLEPGTRTHVEDEIQSFKDKYGSRKRKQASSAQGQELMDVSAEGWSRPQQESHAPVEELVDFFDCPTCQKDISHHVKIRCPKIPFLAPSRMPCADKQFLEGELLEDSKAIATKYSVLIDATCSSLRERAIPVERAVMCLMSIATFLKPTFKQIPLFSARGDDLAKASSFESVLTSINGYHSWFNTYPLKHLIAVLGTKADQDRFEWYEHSLRQYMSRRVFKVFQPIYGNVDTSSCSLFVVKLGSSWDDSTIQELVDVKHDLARILGLQPQALLWSSIDEGCVKLTFSIPSFAVRRIFPLKQLQKAQLLINGVIAFECGDFKFSMIEERNGFTSDSQRYPSDSIDQPPHCRCFLVDTHVQHTWDCCEKH